MSMDVWTVQLDLPAEGNGDTGFFWVAVQDASAPGGYSPVKIWRMLPQEVLIKWRWYFDYRAALHKVNNPLRYVQIVYGREADEAVAPEAHERLQLSRRITSCKAKITEWTRKLAAETARHDEQNPLFKGDWENAPAFQRAQAKLAAKQDELAQLTNQLQTLLPQ